MKTLIAASLVVFSINAYAERVISNAIVCYPTSQVVNSLDNEGETPILIGQNSSSENIVVWLNPKTRSWSVTRTDPAKKETCILDVGESMKPIDQNTKQKKGNV